MKKLKFKAILNNKPYEVVEMRFNSDGLYEICIVDNFEEHWKERTITCPPEMVKLKMEKNGTK